MVGFTSRQYGYGEKKRRDRDNVRFLARATVKMELPFTETKALRRAYSGKIKIFISVKFKTCLNIQVTRSSRQFNKWCHLCCEKWKW